jgi:hypothetical protein
VEFIRKSQNDLEQKVSNFESSVEFTEKLIRESNPNDIIQLNSVVKTRLEEILLQSEYFQSKLFCKGYTFVPDSGFKYYLDSLQQLTPIQEYETQPIMSVTNFVESFKKRKFICKKHGSFLSHYCKTEKKGICFKCQESCKLHNVVTIEDLYLEAKKQSNSVETEIIQKSNEISTKIQILEGKLKVLVDGDLQELKKIDQTSTNALIDLKKNQDQLTINNQEDFNTKRNNLLLEILNLNHSFFKLQKTFNLLKDISNETNPNFFTERFLVAQSKFKNVLTKNLEISDDIIENLEDVKFTKKEASSVSSDFEKIFSQIVSNDSNLLKVDLSYQHLGSEGAEMLCYALKNNSVISHLYLSCLKNFFIEHK